MENKRYYGGQSASIINCGARNAAAVTCVSTTANAVRARNAKVQAFVSMVAFVVSARTGEAHKFVSMVANAVSARTAEAHKFVSMVAFAVSAQSTIVGTTSGVVRAPSVTSLKPKGCLYAKVIREKRNVKMVSDCQKKPPCRSSLGKA
jgi:hypothetical protein